MTIWYSFYNENQFINMCVLYLHDTENDWSISLLINSFYNWINLFFNKLIFKYNNYINIIDNIIIFIMFPDNKNITADYLIASQEEILD